MRETPLIQTNARRSTQIKDFENPIIPCHFNLVYVLDKTNFLVSALKKTYPLYFMSKKKIDLSQGYDVEGLLGNMEKKYQNEITTTIDGLKIDFSDSWVHLRKSWICNFTDKYTNDPFA